MMKIVLIICLLLALPMGCGDIRPEVFERKLDVVGPLVAKNSFVYLHRTATP